MITSGRGGGYKTGRVGEVKFYHYNKVLAMLKGGGGGGTTRFERGFNTGA